MTALRQADSTAGAALHGDMIPVPGGTFRMEKNALHIWPRRSYMMIALPNNDGSYTCTCFWPLEGAPSFAALCSEGDVERFFGEHFPDAAALMPTLAQDYLANPVGTLVTIRCQPWQVADRIAVLGDGRVQAIGSMEELSKIDHPAARQFFEGPRGLAAAKRSGAQVKEPTWKTR